ncbi:MAG: fibronectin type III domain-containing protein [Euryarchaeota archaeon]|nr:fibronectin type III domain-containing protein [Euryarchaeota archaeon]
MSAVWTGAVAYIFGGYEGGIGNGVDDIVKYDPVADSATVIASGFPSVRYGTAAALSGSDAYIFGGWNRNEIFRFNTTTETVTQMAAHVPSFLAYSHAVSVGPDIYLLGGATSYYALPYIWKYTPSTDTLVEMGGRLPIGTAQAAAFWDGSNIYVVGGRNDTSTPLAQIQRYNPATDTASLVAALLPGTRYGDQTAWDGTYAYVFGGCGTQCYTAQVARFEPSTGSLVTMASPLARSMGHGAAIWNGTRAFVFGGWNGSSQQTQIQSYVPAPGAPTGVALAKGPGMGQLTLSWEAPAANTYGAAISAYRVYRSDSPGSEVYVSSTPVTGFTDSGLAPNITYYYQVSAVNPSGEGTLSVEASARTYAEVRPGSPAAFQAAPSGAGRVLLTWLPPPQNDGPPSTGYLIVRCVDDIFSGCSDRRDIDIGDASMYEDTGVASGLYHYYLRAKNLYGAGAFVDARTIAAG